MKNEILLELANRWKREAEMPEENSIEDCHGEQNKTERACLLAADRTERETKRECADALRMLVQLFG